MTTRNSTIRPIPLEIKSGVKPYTDSTPLDTDHYVMSKGIRMFNGKPRKIGGWKSVAFDSPIMGYTRSLYSTVFDAGPPVLLIGTNQHLYSMSGGKKTNITPFKTTGVTLTSVQSYKNTLATNPIATMTGKNIVTVSDPNAFRFRAGDTITMSGASAVNGISAALLNAQHFLLTATPTNYTFQVNDPATSTGSGGGSAVAITSGLLTVTKNAHGMPDQNRVKLSGVSATGGITAPQANSEFIIRNVTTNTFDVMTIGTSTSAASTTTGQYFPEIDPGPVSEFYKTGYGAGLYGKGLYGAPGVSTVARITPRIWFFDKFGEKVLTSPGDVIYLWDGTSTTAPIPLANAPTGINYFFVSDNILVTLGAGGVGNHIFSSDQGDATQWTASSLNQVFEDYIEGAGKFISHVPVPGQNLIFTNTQTYSFRYVGLEAGVWQIKPLDQNTGIISALARVSVNGTAYWMGNDNFYRYRNGNVEVIPANTQAFTTLLDYVFTNINRDQASKCFAEFNQKYNEVWFHYPTADSDEPNRIARVSLTDFSWVPDEIPRTAAENTGFHFKIPYMANIGTLYEHEKGYNDDGKPLEFYLKTNLRSSGKDSTTLVNLVPDSIQTKNINIHLDTFKYPTARKVIYDQDFTFTPDDENIPLQQNSHFWQYTISGNTLDQNWVMGQWYEYVQGGSPQ